MPTFTDAVTVLRGRLAASGVTAPISSRIPNPRPSQFVTLTRIGGLSSDIVVDNPVLVVDAWAATETASHDLLQQVRTALLALPLTQTPTTPVYRVVELSGPAYLPDEGTPNDPHERHRMTVQVSLRASS